MVNYRKDEDCVTLLGGIIAIVIVLALCYLAGMAVVQATIYKPVETTPINGDGCKNADDNVVGVRNETWGWFNAVKGIELGTNGITLVNSDETCQYTRNPSIYGFYVDYDNGTNVTAHGTQGPYQQNTSFWFNLCWMANVPALVTFVNAETVNEDHIWQLTLDIGGTKVPLYRGGERVYNGTISVQLNPNTRTRVELEWGLYPLPAGEKVVVTFDEFVQLLEAI